MEYDPIKNKIFTIPLFILNSGTDQKEIIKKFNLLRADGYDCFDLIDSLSLGFDYYEKPIVRFDIDRLDVVGNNIVIKAAKKARLKSLECIVLNSDDIHEFKEVEFGLIEVPKKERTEIRTFFFPQPSELSQYKLDKILEEIKQLENRNEYQQLNPELIHQNNGIYNCIEFKRNKTVNESFDWKVYINILNGIKKYIGQIHSTNGMIHR